MEEIDSRIPFSGSLTKQQFLYVQRNLLPGWLNYWPIAAVILGLTAFNISVGTGWSTFVRNPLAAWDDVLAAAIIVVIIPLVFRRAWGKAWKQNLELHGDIAGEVHSGGVTWKTAVTTSNFPWDKFVKAKVLPDLILLFYTPRCAYYFPRSFFASEDNWQTFSRAMASRFKGSGSV